MWRVAILFPLLLLVEHSRAAESASKAAELASKAAESASKVAAAPNASGDIKPVNVSVYYQTLCPASQYLIQYPVWNLYQELFKDGIVDINLHAYGNAQETQEESGSYHIACQHGELECKLNNVANCVGHLYKKKKPLGRDIEFVHCLLNDSAPTLSKAKDCALSNKLHWDNIEGCSTGLMGFHLIHKEAAMTPPHDQIPWVMVNGVGESQDQEDLRLHLEEIVCQQYEGNKPTPCSTAAEKKWQIPHDDC